MRQETRAIDPSTWFGILATGFATLSWLWLVPPVLVVWAWLRKRARDHYRDRRAAILYALSEPPSPTEKLARTH